MSPSKGDGRTSNFSLRSWVYIDRMQPQYAAYAGSVIQGDVPIAGMAELFVEVAPSNEIYRVADVVIQGSGRQARDAVSRSASSACSRCIRSSSRPCRRRVAPSSSTRS